MRAGVKSTGLVDKGVEIYNCCFEPAYTILHIVEAMKKVTGLTQFVPDIPNWVIMPMERMVMILGCLWASVLREWRISRFLRISVVRSWRTVDTSLSGASRKRWRTGLRVMTERGWNKASSIIKRLPLRLIFDNNHFDDKYYDMPPIVERAMGWLEDSQR